MAAYDDTKEDDVELDVRSEGPTRIRSALTVLDRAPERAAVLFLNVGLVSWLLRAPPSDETVELLAAIIDAPLLKRDHAADAATALAHHATTHAPSAEALIARLDVINVKTAALAAAALLTDAVEVFEVLHERYRAHREWRFWLTERLHDGSDARWIDEALRVADDDPQAAALTLAQLGTPRAVDELLQWTARDHDFARVKPFIEALARLGERRASPLLLRWLQHVHGTSDERLVLSALGKCGHRAEIEGIRALQDTGREAAGVYLNTIGAIARDT